MLRDIAKTVPLDRLLIETDCPYLTPLPHRGRRNEPAYVSFVAQKLAALHADEPGMSADTIGHITTRNAKHLFKIA
jgi:TatD DNase family protein